MQSGNVAERVASVAAVAKEVKVGREALGLQEADKVVAAKARSRSRAKAPQEIALLWTRYRTRRAKLLGAPRVAKLARTIADAGRGNRKIFLRGAKTRKIFACGAVEGAFGAKSIADVYQLLHATFATRGAPASARYANPIADAVAIPICLP